MTVMDLIKKYGYANYNKGYYWGTEEHKMASKYEEEEKRLLLEIEQKIDEAIIEYKSKLVVGQLSGEWQSVLLVNALRLLNDKERNELALSIIERTTPNLIDEACKKQREICAKAYLRYCSIIEIPTSLASEIRTSPSPKESV